MRPVTTVPLVPEVALLVPEIALVAAGLPAFAIAGLAGVLSSSREVGLISPEPKDRVRGDDMACLGDIGCEGGCEAGSEAGSEAGRESGGEPEGDKHKPCVFIWGGTGEPCRHDAIADDGLLAVGVASLAEVGDDWPDFGAADSRSARTRRAVD